MGDGDLPEGFDIRFATPDDNDQLVEVSRASAIRLGEAKVVVDPGDDYFTAFRLMDEWTALVVTHDERVVGVQCACSFAGRFEHEPARLSQILHTRFHPDYARMGLWSHLQSRMLAAGRDRAASFARGDARALASEAPLATDGDDDEPAPNKLVGVAYVAVENTTVRRLYAGVNPWAAHPFRATIPCAEAAGPVVAKPATSDDADRIAELLNASHEAEELFAPHTPRTLTRRFERAPDLYSWGDVLLSEHAVVGVWHSPEVRRRTGADGTTTASRRALVLDLGGQPGHEDELEALLRHAAANAADAGYDHLSAFACDPSPVAGVARRLADRTEAYDVIVPFIDEPPGLAERGLHVDQAYF